jgi:hypothetical protein
MLTVRERIALGRYPLVSLSLHCAIARMATKQ